MEVARVIDAEGNRLTDARDAYRHVLTQGEHRVQSLAAGEALLLEAGLLVERDGRLYRTDALGVIATLDEASAVTALRARRRSTADQERRELIGAAGEFAVMEEARAGLASLGRLDLAGGVQQMSLVDDTLGFDVLAPSVGGPDRMLEVKTSARRTPGVAEFFLSRNEYTVGLAHPGSWALVACVFTDDSAEVLGWCQASVLGSFLPTDGMGRWTEAFVRLPVTHLTPNIPPPV